MDEVRAKAIEAAIFAWQNDREIPEVIQAYEAALWQPITDAPKTGHGLGLTHKGVMISVTWDERNDLSVFTYVRPFPPLPDADQ